MFTESRGCEFCAQGFAGIYPQANLTKMGANNHGMWRKCGNNLFCDISCESASVCFLKDNLNNLSFFRRGGGLGKFLLEGLWVEGTGRGRF